MALGDWTSAFEQLPADSESAGLGDDRIRLLKEEIRKRGAVGQDFGGSTIDAAYGDTGKMNPGTGRVYRATGALPTTYLKPDGSVQSIALAAADTGHVVLDQNGWADVLHMWDGGLSTPAWVGLPGAPNLVLNGGMRFDQRMVGTAKTLTTATRTKVLDGWAVTITGASTGTVQQVTSGLPTGAISKFGLKIVGAAAVSNVDLDQRFEARDASQWGGYVTVRLGWKYVDGASGTITPSFRVDTCDVADVFSAMTNRATSAFTAGNDAFQTYTFDLSALTNYANGFQIVVRFSGASDLDAATKSVVITDFSITPGRAAPRRFTQPEYQAEYDRCQRYYQKTFAYATVPAQNAGFANSIIMRFDDANNCAVPWQHRVPMVAAGTLTTYNPRAADTGARSTDDSTTKTFVSSTAGASNSFAVFTGSGAGTPQQTFHVHMTSEAGL